MTPKFIQLAVTVLLFCINVAYGGDSSIKISKRYLNLPVSQKVERKQNVVQCKRTAREDICNTSVCGTGSLYYEIHPDTIRFFA